MMPTAQNLLSRWQLMIELPPTWPISPMIKRLHCTWKRRFTPRSGSLWRRHWTTASSSMQLMRHSRRMRSSEELRARCRAREWGSLTSAGKILVSSLNLPLSRDRRPISGPIQGHRVFGTLTLAWRVSEPRKRQSERKQWSESAQWASNLPMRGKMNYIAMSYNKSTWKSNC